MFFHSRFLHIFLHNNVSIEYLKFGELSQRMKNKNQHVNQYYWTITVIEIHFFKNPVVEGILFIFRFIFYVPTPHVEAAIRSNSTVVQKKRWDRKRKWWLGRKITLYIYIYIFVDFSSPYRVYEVLLARWRKPSFTTFAVKR